MSDTSRIELRYPEHTSTVVEAPGDPLYCPLTRCSSLAETNVMSSTGVFKGKVGNDIRLGLRVGLVTTDTMQRATPVKVLVITRNRLRPPRSIHFMSGDVKNAAVIIAGLFFLCSFHRDLRTVVEHCIGFFRRISKRWYV
jgi:hypothetical protein